MFQKLFACKLSTLSGMIRCQHPGRTVKTEKVVSELGRIDHSMRSRMRIKLTNPSSRIVSFLTVWKSLRLIRCGRVVRIAVEAVSSILYRALNEQWDIGNLLDGINKCGQETATIDSLRKPHFFPPYKPCTLPWMGFRRGEGDSDGRHLLPAQGSRDATQTPLNPPRLRSQ